LTRQSRSPMPKKLFLSLLILALFLLHQDVWNWRQAEPLVFGFLPIGLAYHAAYCIGAALLMAVLVKFAWPTELDRVERERKDDDHTPLP
jgi:hypothetical protein